MHVPSLTLPKTTHPQPFSPPCKHPTHFTWSTRDHTSPQAILSSLRTSHVSLSSVPRPSLFMHTYRRAALPLPPSPSSAPPSSNSACMRTCHPPHALFVLHPSLPFPAPHSKPASTLVTLTLTSLLCGHISSLPLTPSTRTPCCTITELPYLTAVHVATSPHHGASHPHTVLHHHHSPTLLPSSRPPPLPLHPKPSCCPPSSPCMRPCFSLSRSTRSHRTIHPHAGTKPSSVPPCMHQAVLHHPATTKSFSSLRHACMHAVLPSFTQRHTRGHPPPPPSKRPALRPPHPYSPHSFLSSLLFLASSPLHHLHAAAPTATPYPLPLSSLSFPQFSTPTSLLPFFSPRQ